GAGPGDVELGLGHDADPPAAVEGGVEADPGLLQLDLHGQRVDDLDALDGLEDEDEQLRRPRGVRAPVGVEVVLHDLGGELGAVVERDPLAETDRPLRVVLVGLDRLGEPRLHLALGVGAGQGVVDRRGHHDPADGQLGLGQAPAVDGLGLEPVDDAPAGRRIAGALVAGGPAVAVAAPAASGGNERERQHGRDPRQGGTAGPPPRRADPSRTSVLVVARAVPCPPARRRAPRACRPHVAPLVAVTDRSPGLGRDARHNATEPMTTLESCQQATARPPWVAPTVPGPGPARPARPASIWQAAATRGAWRRRTVGLLAGAALLAAGCRTPGGGRPGGDQGPPVRLNEIQVLASHNSYHVEPEPVLMDALTAFLGDEALGFGYTHRPLAEQLD